MKRVLLIVAAAVMAAATTAQNPTIESGADEVIVHWNNDTAPHSSLDPKAEVVVKRGSGYKVTHTSETVFYLFKAQNPTGHAIAHFPGGGYESVNLNFGMAKWLSQNGITTVIVKYRLPNGHREVPLEDAKAAVAFLRQNAERLGIDPNKVGVSGNSAGGHLAAWSSNVLEDERPNFAVLIYPVISGKIWSSRSQQATLERLLGKWRTDIDIENHSCELLVTPQTPPTLLLHSDDDDLAATCNSTLYYKALKHHGVKASLHFYPSGGHGWFGRDKWEYRQQWLKAVKEWASSL